MQPGDWIVATAVCSETQRIETDAEWTSRLMERTPNAELGDIVSVSSPVRRPAQKRYLHSNTGAMAVDMESYQAAVLAQELGVPFAAVRVIADPVERELPPAAHLGLQPDGTVAIGEVIGSLLRQPQQIPRLARVTVDAFIAFRALLKGRDKLGPRFASLNCPTVLGNRSLSATGSVHTKPSPLPI
jgi:hypothetical protein